MESAPTNKDPQEKQLIELATLADSDEISADEMFTAYQIALGFSLEEMDIKQPPRKEVYDLAEKLDESMNNGLALNRIADMIGGKRAYDSAPEMYNVFVDDMKITDKEKSVLRSIVAKKRYGTLTIIDAQTGNDLDELEIPEYVVKENYPRNILSIQLLMYLKRYRDMNMEISFTE